MRVSRVSMCSSVEMASVIASSSSSSRRACSRRSFICACFSALAAWRVIAPQGGMATARLQELQVDRVKRARARVQPLGDAYDLVGAVAQWDAQYAAGAKSGAPIDLRIEARVAVGVVDNFSDTRAEYRARDADVLRDPDLRHALAARLP